MKRHIQKCAVIASVALFSALIVSMGCNRKHERPEIRVGVIVPLTGGAADFGKWAKRGVDLAVSALNSNSASKFSFRAVYEDHQMDVKQGVTSFKKLADIDNVKAVVTSGSGVVLAIAPEADRAHIIQLNYAAVSPAICGSGDYTFTLVNNADVETDEIAELAIKKLRIAKVAILYANAAYGVTTKDSVVKSFKSRGGEILGEIAFQEGFTDIRAQLLQIKEMNPPAVYFIATIKDSGRLLKQAKELGVTTQWLTYNAFESPEVLSIAGDAADGVIYTSSNLFDLPNPPASASSFLRAYMNAYGERPNIYTATAYDSIMLLSRAIAQSDGTQEGIRSALTRTSDYEGAGGRIAFDSHGCVKKLVFLKAVRQGRFVVYE
jgi:branched-chain amino acid transport system substrate-binding protein